MSAVELTCDAYGHGRLWIDGREVEANAVTVYLEAGHVPRVTVHTEAFPMAVVLDVADVTEAAPPARVLDRVRVVALAWIHQVSDGCEDTAQQIKDGHTMLRLLDGGAS